MYPVLELFHLLVFLVQSVVLHFSVLTFQCQFLETAELVFLQLVSHSLAVFHMLAAEAAAEQYLLVSGSYPVLILIKKLFLLHYEDLLR